MTDENIEAGDDQIKCKKDPNGGINGDEQAHVHFSIGHKHSAVLQQNSEFNEEKRRPINDIRDMYPL